MARALPEDGQPAYIQPFQDSLATPEGQKSLEEDVERRKQVFTSVLVEVKGLGDGSEKGASLPSYLISKISLWSAAEIEGFFNLFFSHFLALYPLDEPETRSQLAILLKTISASSNQASARYRMYEICHC